MEDRSDRQSFPQMLSCRQPDTPRFERKIQKGIGLLRFEFRMDLLSHAKCLVQFFQIVGAEAWFKRVDQLDIEQRTSPFLGKIVADYHWLEMAISHQHEVLRAEGRLQAEYIDTEALIALRLASAIVEVHARLSPVGQRELEGRIRDCMQADAGFAPLYLELNLALQLMEDGYDVIFRDLEKTGRFDLEISRGTFVSAVECKSLSVDAGRRIHRKDFYRLIDSLMGAMDVHLQAGLHECILVTLKGRLPSNLTDQAELRRDLQDMLRIDGPPAVARADYDICRRVDALEGNFSLGDADSLNKACRAAFGMQCHAAGAMTVAAAAW